MVDTSTSDDSNWFLLEDGKVSNGMRKTLEGLINTLHCPLCDEIFRKPTTLASCGHSFCETCIDNYNSSSSICPVQRCGMPMSVVGGGRGSFRRINPQLAQCVESLKLVCQGLNRAPKHWWKDNNLQLEEGQATASTSAPLDVHTCYSDDAMGHESDSDVENCIDLQSVNIQGKKDYVDDDWQQ